MTRNLTWGLLRALSADMALRLPAGPRGHGLHRLDLALLRDGPAQLIDRWGKGSMTTRSCGLLATFLVTLHLAGPSRSQEGSQRRRSVTSVSACFGKRVAVLDLTAFADSAGIPGCNVDTDFKVSFPLVSPRCIHHCFTPD